jgi:hypothetical protein
MICKVKSKNPQILSDIKSCIVFLIKDDPLDIANFNDSVRLLSKNVISILKTKCDLILFVEEGFNQLNLNLVDITNYQIIEVQLYDNNFNLDYASNYYPHPTHGSGPIAYGHPGFSLGYRLMCRFFSGSIFKEEILGNYDYMMRLDCDSRILTQFKMDPFLHMNKRGAVYGFIEGSVQFDNYKVSLGFNEVASRYVRTYASCVDKLRQIFFVKKYGIYYTNFEICYIPWFKSTKYLNFFNFLDSHYGFITNRWGDALVRYYAVKSFLPPKKRIPIRGFVYQHGAIYENSDKFFDVIKIKIILIISRMKHLIDRVGFLSK